MGKKKKNLFVTILIYSCLIIVFGVLAFFVFGPISVPLATIAGIAKIADMLMKEADKR